MIHLFLQADEYLASQRLAELKAALGDADLAGLNTTELEAGRTTAAAVLAEAALMPFLTSQRMVIVHGYLDHLDKRLAASKSADSQAQRDAAQLLDGLPGVPDTALLVFIDAAVDRRRALWKGFQLPAGGSQPERKVPGLETLVKAGAAKLEDLKAPDLKTLPAWIQQQARQRSIAIDGGAVAVLADFVGPNLRQLDSELEKLSLYAWQRTITAADVRAMVSDTNEEMIWNLTDGLTQRNPKLAMRSLRELLRREQNPIGLLSAIARQYRLLIQVKSALQQQPADADALAARLGEKAFPVKKALQLAPRYTYAELVQIMDRLLEADMAMKTGADQEAEIDVLVAELTQVKKA